MHQLVGAAVRRAALKERREVRIDAPPVVAANPTLEQRATVVVADPVTAFDTWHGFDEGLPDERLEVRPRAARASEHVERGLIEAAHERRAALHADVGRRSQG